MGKKVLCFLILSAVFIGINSFSSAASGFADTNETKYETAANLLYALDIIEGEDDGTFGVNESMTRADFAGILVKLGGLSDADDNAIYFVDVPKEHYARNQINAVCKLGFMQGEGKYFRPEESLTLEEASRGLVFLLGYAGTVENGSYTIAANRMGLHTNISRGTWLSRGDILLMVYEALNIPLMLPTHISDSGIEESRVENESDILSNNFNIYKSSGQFTAAGDVDLVRITNDDPGCVRIDDKLYKLGEGVAAGKEIIARNVQFYYQIDDKSEVPVLVHYQLNKNDKVIRAEAADIDASSSTVTKLVYTASGKASGRVRAITQKIPTSAKFIVNGQIIPDSEKSGRLFDFSSGSVTVVTPGNGNHCVVWIESYAYYTVAAGGVDCIFLKTGVYDGKEREKMIELTQDEESQFDIYAPTGEPASLDAITANSGIAFAEVVSANGKTYKTIHILNSIRGTVTRIAGGKILVDSEEYEIMEGLDKELDVGYRYNLFIGMDGAVCLAGERETSSLSFGYLVNIACTGGELSPEFNVKILNSAGEQKEHKIADKVYINDEAVRTGKYADKSNAIYQALFIGGEKPRRQVIAYRERDDGKITHIFTAQSADGADGNSDAVLSLDAPQAKLQCKTGSAFTFSGVLTRSETGFIVAVPQDLLNASDDDFEVWQPSYFSNDGKYLVEGYNVNEMLEAEILVVTVENLDEVRFNDANTYTCVFDSMSHVLLDDGTQAISITYWQQGEKFEKIIEDRSGMASYENTLLAANQLARGDCFKIELTGDKSKIKNLAIEFVQAKRLESATGFNGGRLLFYGQVQAVSNDAVVIRHFVDSPDTNYLGPTVLSFRGAGRVKTYMYTGDNREIEYLPNCLADVRVGDWVLYQARYMNARALVIYRDDRRLPNGSLIQ